jgi:nucleoside-diphosphate-sugar epimerase
MKQHRQHVLVTGATGFIGRFLCNRLLTEDFCVRGTILASENPADLVAGVQPVIIKPLGGQSSWDESLAGIDTVIHLAARVHIMNDPSDNPLDEFRKVNVDGTTQLARAAAIAGVKRMVFISSIKVSGEDSDLPYALDSTPMPSDAYGTSKWEAEQALRRIEAETDLEVVVVRPTLVYGPGVKANFLTMMKTIKKGIPLPLASINNRRSLIYVGNLVDALTACAISQMAAGKTYLVSDGDDVSTPELIRRTATALGVPARLFPVPVSLMRLAGKLIGKSGAVNRLTGSLTIDSSDIRQDLGWVNPFTMDEGLRVTAEWFNNNKE